MISYNTIVFVNFILFVYLISSTHAQSEWDVRLTNDTIFEVYLLDQWGTPCDDFWSLANTDVVCRSIGYRRGKSFSSGIKGHTSEFHLDDVICLGNESHIRNCKYRLLGDDCSANEHIRITCEKDGCESYAPFADAEPILVKYYSDGQWYYLSSDYFTLENANVVCLENTQTAVETISYQILEASSSLRIYPYSINCSGDENSLCECRKSLQASISDSIVKIKCKSNEGELRLVNAVNKNSGFVLINHNEAWKGICFEEHSSNFQTAYVACKQLGYRGLYNFYYDNALRDTLNGGSYFTSTKKDFDTWITQPNCTGEESYITECAFNGWDDYNCLYNALWVNCEPYGNHDVTLINNTLQYSGIPRIFYNNQWHSICIPGVSIDDHILNAICRSLGAISYNNWQIVYETASSYLYLNYTCFGKEENLASCYSEEILDNFCRDSVQLYLSCNQPLDETPSVAYGSSETGIIDLHVENKWGISCINSTDDFEQIDGQIICNQLGLNGVYWELIDNEIGEQKYWESIFNCSGDETSLSEGNCLETIGYTDQCSQQSKSTVKLFCRPSSNEMRLMPSLTNSSFFSLQFLTPERTWASVCSNIPNIQICNTFGYNSVDVMRMVSDNVHTYTELACPPDAIKIEQCTVKFKYDYISVYGCSNTLEIYCSNMEAPTFAPTDLEGLLISDNSILFKWTYNYGISEEQMNFRYNMEISINDVPVYSLDFDTGDIDWEYDVSRVNTRYYTVINFYPYIAYSFKLQLVNAAGFGRFGNSIQIAINVQEPQITTPSEDKVYTITSVSELESFSLTQPCIATGKPQPTITWTSNTSIIQNTTDHILTVEPGDLSTVGEYIICTASNTAGRDSRSITITINIELTTASSPIVKGGGATFIEIMWSEYSIPDYVVSYEICVKIANEGDCVQRIKTTATDYLIENLETDMLYRITVVVVTEFGRSPASKPLAVEISDSVEPEINFPVEDTFFVITSPSELEFFSLTQPCISSGIPQPTISWMSNTNLTLSRDTLEIQAGDLSIDNNINPYVFTCIANNSVGEDSKEVRITIDIDVDGYLNDTENITDYVVSLVANIILANSMVNVSSENSSTAQDSIDNSAEELEKLINKFIDGNKIDETKIGVIENIFLPASEIIRQDLELSSKRDRTNMEGARGIATASRALQKTLNSIESLVSNFASNIEIVEDEPKSVAISSADITVVAQNIVLSDKYSESNSNVSEITIPDLANVKNEPITERIEIPIEVAKILSKNNKNLRIATTIVRYNRKKTEKQPNYDSPSLFSNIVSVVVPDSKGRKINLPKPVKMSIPVPQSNSEEQNQICSSLNQSSWSTEGLTTGATEKNITFCFTVHFTSFAVFVTPRKLMGSDDLKRIASVVSYVLVSISFIFLLLSLVLFLLSAKTFFKVEANIVYFNYCLAMTLAFGLFIFGIETGTIHKTACMVIAFGLHYIWLAVFVWTLCNGILIMYKLTIGILRQHKIYPYLIVFGWTVPIIIPIITVAIKHGDYVNTNEHCFLTYKDGLIWAFTGPIVVILFINLIILFIATIRIATTKFGTDRIDEKQALRKGLISALILTPLLGIPWSLLLFNIFIANPIVQWSFIIVNGLMGVFFFIAVTLRNAEVKKLCVKVTKDSSQASTSITDGKSSGMFSKKFKRAVSKDSNDPLSPPSFSSDRKGAYFALEPVSSIQESDYLNTRKVSEKGAFKYDDTPPKPKNFPKPRKLQKGSTSVDSVDEGEEFSRYDVPNNLRSVDVPIYDIVRTDSPESKRESPIYEIVPEDVPTDYESIPEINSKQIVNKKKVYQNLDEFS